jgi:hypothetical protein
VRHALQPQRQDRQPGDEEAYFLNKTYIYTYIHIYMHTYTYTYVYIHIYITPWRDSMSRFQRKLSFVKST